MTTLTVSLIQTDLYYQDPEANLAALEEKIWEIESPTDIIVLPEMFNTGFYMNPEKLAEPMNFNTFRWMNRMAKQKNAAVVGSYMVKESTKYYNRLYWVEPDGSFDFYDKRHLYRMGEEHRQFTAGKKRLIRSFRGWKIMPLICYDLRFPVWSKNRFHLESDELDYDLLIYVANWPKPRTEVWTSLLKARALENQCYSIGVNRTGSDSEGIDYIGHSAIYDFKGGLLNEITETPTIQSVRLNLEDLHSFRQKFPVYRDWDGFDIRTDSSE